MRPWDLEEAIEDGFVALLKSKLSANWKVLAALAGDIVEYPAVCVTCANTGKTAADASFDINRTAKVTIDIYVEDAPVFDGDVQTKTARENNRECRAEVMGVLATETLKDDLNKAAAGVGVEFGGADLDTTARSVDSGNRLLVTSAAVDVWACPTNR